MQIELFRTIVIEYKGSCVAMASILIRRLDNQVCSNIGQIMINQSYPTPFHLIHLIVFTFEQLAWIHNSDYVIIRPIDVLNALEVIKELEYQ